MSRNHPNMSYCAFENTANAIRQVIGIIEDAHEEGMTFGVLIQSRSSKHESRAAMAIAQLAQELIDALTDLDYNIVDDEELAESEA